MFKWKIPMAHRLTIFLALIYSWTSVLKMMYGRPVSIADVLGAALFCSWAAFHSYQRQTAKWQLTHPDGHGDGILDMLQQRFDHWPSYFRVAYWLVIVLAAYLIYVLVPGRG